MSKISLSPDASGTGIFTIASPNSNTNRTLTLPDDTGTIVTNSGNQAGSFTTLNTSGAVVFNDAGADVDFRVEGDTDANLLFVDASADKVGVGTGSPSYKLDVVSTSMRIASGTTGVGYVQHGNSATASQNWHVGTEGDGTYRFYNGNFGSGSLAVTLDSSGNVLVGTTGAAYSTSGRGLIETNGSSSSMYALKVGGTGVGYFAASSSVTELAAVGASQPLLFTTNGSERMRINSSGYVKASPSGTYNLSAGTFHEFRGDSTFVFVAESTGASGQTAVVLAQNYATANAATYLYTGRNGSATDVFRVAANGNVTNTNNSYGAISDVKLKQDIVDAESQWDDIKGLRVRKYRWKSDPDGFMQIGLVAQEAEALSPGLIEEHPDYEEVTRTREIEKIRVVTEAVLDEDGNEIEPAVTETYTEEEEYTESVALDTTTKSVKYSVLYMKAVKALQEAMERIETLEASNTALEARITALETGA